MRRRPASMLYCGVRMIAAMRSLPDAKLMSRAMSYADDTLAV